MGITNNDIVFCDTVEKKISKTNQQFAYAEFVDKFQASFEGNNLKTPEIKKLFMQAYNASEHKLSLPLTKDYFSISDINVVSLQMVSDNQKQRI